MSVLSPNAELIRRRLVGQTVIGPEPDLEALTDEELGALAAPAWATELHDYLVLQLQARLQERAPEFDAASALSALESLIVAARRGPSLGDARVVDWIRRSAAQVLERCPDPGTPAMLDALGRLLAEGMPSQLDPLASALLSSAGLAVPSADDELVQREVTFLCSLMPIRTRIAAARACTGWVFGADDDKLTPRGADPLALLPGYLDFAAGIVASAVERIRGIQVGEIPYRADKAFSVDGAQVVRRALLAGLDQELPWAIAAALPLLSGASRAPIDNVKTVPSQSLAVAVAKAIADRPTPAVVGSMSPAVSNIRHAGLKKKVAAFFKTAERRLFEHDDFLLELDPAAKPQKELARPVVRALETLLVKRTALPFDVFRTRFLESRTLSDHVASLIWRFEDIGAALPVRGDRGWSFLDALGKARGAPKGSVTLWHPLEAHAMAEEFRRLVIDRKLAQPFNQAFRETYSPTSYTEWFGVKLDARTLLGLARSEGWRMCDSDTLVRRIGRFRVQLTVHGIYPGAMGVRTCSRLALFRETSPTPVDPSKEDPLAVSECIRAVDLLVSVSAFALVPETAEQSSSARARRAALVAMLGEDPACGGAYVDGRNVRTGDVAISIATGRASRNGAELSPPSESTTTSVIPYPDPTLRLIVTRINAH